MISLSKGTYQDLNGDGNRDAGDLYGWVGYNKFCGFQSAFVNCYSETKDGTIALDYDLEKLIDVVTKVTDVFNNSKGGYLIGNEPNIDLFSRGNVLFYVESLGKLTSDLMRNSEVDYGLLPVPKYDEAQGEYYTDF